MPGPTSIGRAVWPGEWLLLLRTVLGGAARPVAGRGNPPEPSIAPSPTPRLPERQAPTARPKPGRSSIDEAGSPAELARRLDEGFAALYRELRDRRAGPEEIRAAVAHHLDAYVVGEDGGLLPDRLAAELRAARRDDTGPNDELADLLEGHLRADADDAPHVALQLVTRLLAWHAWDRLRDDDEHACAEAAQELRPIAPHHVWRLRVHLLIQAAVAVATAVATFVGTLHASGWLLDALDVPLSPRDQRWIRYGMSAVLGLTTSYVVMRAKAHLERHLYLGAGLVPSVRRTYRDWLFTPARPFSALAAAVVTAIIGADVYTNFTGGAAFFAATRDREMQLDDVHAELDRRVEDARAQIGAMAEVEEAARGYVAEVLGAEAGGASYSDTPGQGPLYHAKRLLLEEDPASRVWLAESSSPLSRALLAVVDGSPLTHDGLSLAEELGQRAEAGERAALEVLDGIEAERSGLSPKLSIEELQERIDAIVGRGDGGGRFAELVAVHGRAQAELEAHRRAYNELLRQIADTAERVGGYQVAPGAIEALELRPMQLDRSPIVVPELQFREATELVRSAWEGFSAPVAVFILVASAIGAILFSYLDLVTGAWGPTELKTVHARDRAAAERIRGQLQRVRASVVDVLGRVLGEGPLSRAIASQPIPRDRIAAALAQVERDARPPRRLADRLRHTSEATDANRMLLGFRAAVADPGGVGRILDALTTDLAGYRPDVALEPLVAGPSRPDRRRLVRAVDRSIDAARLAEVAAELDTLKVRAGSPDELAELWTRAERIRATLASCRERSRADEARALEQRLQAALDALPVSIEEVHREERRRAVDRAAGRVLDELQTVVITPETDRRTLERAGQIARRALDELRAVRPEHRGAPEGAWARALAAAEGLDRRVGDTLRRHTEREREAKRRLNERERAVRERVASWLLERRETPPSDRPALLVRMLYDTGHLEAPVHLDRLTAIDREEVYRAALGLIGWLREYERPVAEDLAGLR